MLYLLIMYANFVNYLMVASY